MIEMKEKNKERKHYLKLNKGFANVIFQKIKKSKSYKMIS